MGSTENIADDDPIDFQSFKNGDSALTVPCQNVNAQDIMTPERHVSNSEWLHYSVHNLVTPTKEGKRAHVTLGKMILRSKSDLPQAQTNHAVFWSSMRISPTDSKALEGNSCQSQTMARNKSYPAAKRIKYDACLQDIRPFCGISSGDIFAVQNQKDKLKKKSLNWRHVACLHFFLLFALCGFTYFVVPYENSPVNIQWNLSTLNAEFSSKVFGQEKAIITLMEAVGTLVELNNNSQQPIIIISGGNGVGKTLAMSIIANHFPSPGQSHFLILPPLPPYEAVLNHFASGGPHLLVIDNLNIQSCSSVFSWMKEFYDNMFAQNKIIWTALIFNVQVFNSELIGSDDHSFTEILEHSGKAVAANGKSFGFDVLHVHFPPLKSVSIRKCIKNAFEQRGLIVNTHIDGLVDEIVRIPEDRFEGCKRVWSRVLALHISSDFLAS